jgi:hypothetical protein
MMDRAFARRVVVMMFMLGMGMLMRHSVDALNSLIAGQDYSDELTR